MILGDMLELGQDSEPEHKKLLDLIQTVCFDKVFLVGNILSEIVTGHEFKTFQNVLQLCDFLKAHPIQGSLILIKGSRGIQLEKVLEVLD